MDGLVSCLRPRDAGSVACLTKSTTPIADVFNLDKKTLPHVARIE